MLLLAAAGFKAWPLITGQAAESQAASLGKLILIQGEVLLALWLMSGINVAWAFRAAIVFFTGAAMVNLRSIWLGEVSCGCFGKVSIDPTYSLMCNLVLLTGLTMLDKSLFRGAPTAAFSTLLLLAILLLPAAVSRDTRLLESKDAYQLLRPSEWIGKSVPVARIRARYF